MVHVVSWHAGTMSGFRWGVTTSSVQIEGVHESADWSRWEATKRVPASTDGNGFATNFHDDLALIASLGITDIRLTLEWARIEPVEGKTDAEALDRYADILAAARSVGLAPWITLVSTSLPGWFSEDGGGFVDDKARNLTWMRHVDRCAERFNDFAEGYTPIDDPVGWALRGWGLGSRPPGRRSDSEGGPERLSNAIRSALVADHLAARHLHSGGATTMAVRGTPTIFNVLDDPRSGQEADAAQQHVRWWANVLFDSWINMIGNGELAMDDRTPEHDHEWTSDFDFVGLAFDHPIGLNHEGAMRPYPPDGLRADNGFAPLPEELGVLLQRISERLPATPLMVAANGVATTNDEWRCEVLAATLGIVATAQADGMNLVGYFHDTAIDGYEWKAGFDTHRGLIARDRVPKRSAQVLKAAIDRTRSG